MHVGHDFPTSYHLQNGEKLEELQTVKEEKDLGVYTTNDLKPGRHWRAAAARASSMLGLIKRHFKMLDIRDFRLLYKAYIRPHLEYCVQVWNPSLARDIACLESIQRRPTQIVAGFRNKPYKERLRLLGLTKPLEKRRTRGDN